MTNQSTQGFRLRLESYDGQVDWQANSKKQNSNFKIWDQLNIAGKHAGWRKVRTLGYLINMDRG
jgi:hypothetical protein